MHKKIEILIIFRFFYLFFSGSFLLFPGLNAQDKSQYLLREIPQTISLNPAINYHCKSYIELPVVSQISLYYRNNGFSYKQAFNSGTGITGDSISLNIDGLDDAIRNRNYIRLGGRINLLGFGISYKDIFFSFNISNNTSSRISYNNDIISARDGNWDLASDEPKELSLKGSGIHWLNYTEFAFGAGSEIFPGFSVGTRIKYLLGSSHLQTRRSDINLVTTQNPILLRGSTDLLIRGSLPVSLTLDDEGFVNDIQSNVNSASDVAGLLFTGNHGMAVDAGIIYEYSGKLTFAASIIDLGFIRWRKNLTVVSQEEEFYFNGFDLNDYLQTGDDTDFLQALQDSINESFRLAGSESPYSAILPARIFASADYQINDKLTLGAVLETEMLSMKVYPALTLNAIARPEEWITASLSYSLMDRGFANLGLGLILGSGPVQFYFITDHIPLNYVREINSGLLLPYNARTMNVRFGLNILTGCREKQETNYRRLKWRKSCPAYR